MLAGAPGLESSVDLRFSIQTNGTRLTPEWAAVFGEYGVDVGISLDGPQEINDLARVDHRGRGSHAAVARGINVLRDADVPFAILSVIQLGADPLRIHGHFLDLGCNEISYLLPSYTHDEIGPIRERYGGTPCADFLIPIFDEWFDGSTVDVSIREFWEIGRTILGGVSKLDVFGNPPIRFLTGRDRRIDPRARQAPHVRRRNDEHRTER